MPILYIIATPIGNLEDLTFRGLRILKEVDLILAEDTNLTRKLLDYYGIKTPLLSYHQHSKLKKIQNIIQLLREGKNLALVSDAGTPGISDPGGKLIDLAIQQIKNLKIVPIPGPSALTCAASVAGFPMDKFLFLGFPPAKRKRKRFFEEVINSKYPVIFYESPYRILKSLRELEKIDKELKVLVAKELTKKFETIYRGKICQVLAKIERDKIKGEFVVIVEKKKSSY